MASWNALIDWSNDGDYSDTGEDVSARVIGQITFERGKDQLRAVSPPVAGRLTMTLNNVSKDYSAENESSPLYGNLLPGRRLQIKGAGSALWTGLVDEIQQNARDKTVTVTALGTLSRLANKKVSIGVLENVTTSAVITAILDELSWPGGDRVISTGDTTLSYFFAHDVDAFTLIVALWWTEGPGCSIYEDENGKFVFENRNYRTSQTRSTNSQFTFTDSSHITDAAYTPDNLDISNECAIDIEVRSYQVGQTIWTLDQQTTFSNNETKTWIARTAEPFANPVAPSPAPSNASQLITASTTLTGGAFKFKWRGQTTASIAYNDSASTIQSRFDAILGAGTTLVTGSLAAGLLIIFIGTLGGQEITDLIEAVESTLNPVSVAAEIIPNVERAGDGIFIERQSLTPDKPLTSGTFTISIPGYGTTGSLNYNAALVTIHAALQAVNTNLHAISGGPINTSQVILQLGTGPAVGVVTINPSSIMGSTAGASLSVAVESAGGESDYTVLAGAITARSITQTGPQTAIVSMTAGASGATINRSRAKADVFGVIRSEQVKNNNDLSASIAKYGLRPVSHSILPGISQATAQTLANLHAAFYANPRPSLPFVVPGKNATLETQNLTRKVSDRITPQEGQTGINDPYHIEHLAYTLIPSNVANDAKLNVVYGCEKVL